VFIPDERLVNSFTLPAVSATSSEASVHTGRIVGGHNSRQSTTCSCQQLNSVAQVVVISPPNKEN